MRPTLLANIDEKSVFCGGTIETGDVFRFSLPPDFEVIDKVVESSALVRDEQIPEADAMIIFSCVGRFMTLGPMINDELEGLANTWNVPMAGFFCLGEFGKVAGARQAEFHGTTVSWAVIKERGERGESRDER